MINIKYINNNNKYINNIKYNNNKYIINIKFNNNKYINNNLYM